MPSQHSPCAAQLVAQAVLAALHLLPAAQGSVTGTQLAALPLHCWCVTALVRVDALSLHTSAAPQDVPAGLNAQVPTLPASWQVSQTLLPPPQARLQHTPLVAAPSLTQKPL